MKTVKLITCNDAMKAHILQGALENEGIESILHNENFSTLYKSCVSNIAGVDILVADEDYENAVQVLRDNDSWPEELTLCPYCGSSDIQLVLRKGKRWRALGAAIISALMVTPPGDNHWNYTCKQCHKTFEMPVSKFNPSAETEEKLYLTIITRNEKEKTSINCSSFSMGGSFVCCQSRYFIN